MTNKNEIIEKLLCSLKEIRKFLKKANISDTIE